MYSTRCSDCSGIYPESISVVLVSKSWTTAVIVFRSPRRRRWSSHLRLNHTNPQRFPIRDMRRLANGCSDSVTILFRSVFRWTGHCSVEVLVMFLCLWMFHLCYDNISVMFLGVPRVFHWCFGDVQVVFQCCWCSEVPMMSHGMLWWYSSGVPVKIRPCSGDVSGCSDYVPVMCRAVFRRSSGDDHVMFRVCSDDVSVMFRGFRVVFQYRQSSDISMVCWGCYGYVRVVFQYYQSNDIVLVCWGCYGHVRVVF